MVTITIRNLDDEVKSKLRVVAAEKGHSMEAEVREILAWAADHQKQIVGERENRGKSGSEKFYSLKGMWAGRGTTAERMAETRGES